MIKQTIFTFKEKFNSDQLKILSNMSWLFSERIFRMGTGFLILAWTARYLGVDQFGTLNYAIAFVALFSPIVQLASDQIIFRDLIQKSDLKNTILGTSFLIKSIAGIAIFVLATLTILLIQNENSIVLKLVIIVGTSSFFSGFSTIEQWFQSQVDSKYTILARNSSFIVSTILRLILFRLHAPVEYFAWLVVIELFLNSLGFIFVFQASGNDILKWKFNRRYSQDLMQVSFPLIFSSLAIVIYMRIDQVMLGQLASAQSVGIYSAAVKLSEIWPFASTVIVKSLAPSIILEKESSEYNYYRKLQRLCNFQACLVYIIAIPMIFLSKPFVVLVFGSEYSAAGVILSIHIWSSMFLFLGYVKEIWITTEGITWFAFAFTVSGAIMNVILNYLLIPIYQEVGAALATVISYAFADYVMCFIHPQARRFGWMMTQAMSLGLIKAKNTL